MALVIPNAMKEAFLQAIKLDRLQNDNNIALCGLYVFDTVPTVESVASDFYQPSYSNYEPLRPVGWSRCYINQAGSAETDAAPLVWTVEDAALVPFTVYGYFLYDEYQNLLWAELLEGGPITIDTVGQSISLLLSLTYGACESMLARVEKRAPKPKVPKGAPQGTKALRMGPAKRG